MARISTKLDEKVFKISKFLGVNESPNGDTGLQLGEASAMQNFKITDEGALQKRAGTRNVAGLLSQYAIHVAAEPVILRDEVVNTTATFSVKPNISLSETGLLSLSGEEATLNYANHPNYTGYYYLHTDGNIYKFVDCEYSDGIVNGVQQYRWSKWNTITSYYSYYILSFRELGTFSSSEGLTGYSSYSFDPYTGRYSASGSLIHITNSGTIYSGNGRITALGGGRFVSYYADVSGPYYGSTTSKGSTFLGYVYGPSGAYPNGGTKTVDGTTYWFDNRVEAKEYKWKFAPVTVVNNQSDKVVRGIWSGFVGGTEYIVGACNGHLWSLSIDEQGVWSKTDIGVMDTDNPVHMFAFDNKLYILNGVEYYVWDGTILTTVEGYRPLVSVARSPDGSSQTSLEQINMLNSKRRVWFSPNGTAKDFILPNEDIVTIDYVLNRITGQSMQFTADVAGKKVTFSTAPSQGVNTIEVGYSVAENQRNEVIAMRFSEFYSGTTDSRVFLYGDGTNKAIYSGIDYDGKARADYFPALNVLHVGNTATPITGMIRHYNKLMAFKTDSAYTIDYDTITLVDGSVTAGFFVKPVNRGLGNAAPGQVCLVENNPRTLDAGCIYEWQTNAFTYDQRNAVRVSDKVAQTLSRMDLTQAVAFYDKITHEYYVAQNGLVVVQNLQNGAWYVYANLPITCMINYKDEFYFGTPDGYIRRMSRDYFGDNGEPIECYWESGATDFNAPHRLKYSRGVWVTIKPEPRGEIKVTAITDKANQLAELSTSASGFFSFLDLDFEALSFNTSRTPTMEAHKIKAKKFVYYKLIFASDSNNTTATVTDVAMHVRYLSHVR